MTGRLTPQLKLINAKSAANEFVFVTNSADATPRLSEAKEAQYRNHDDHCSDEPNYVVHNISPENLLLRVNSSEPTNVPAFFCVETNGRHPFRLPSD